MNGYQESQSKNINLMDLIFYCLEKWRWIVACMLLAAVIIGAYKYQETVKENQILQRSSVEENTEDLTQKSIEFYEHAIEEMEYDLGIQKDYLKHSIVMELDPYHIKTGTLSYYIEGGEHTDSLIAAYSAFISSGSMVDKLYAEYGDIPVEDLRYLISFSDETYEMINSQVIKTIGNESDVFQIQISMPDKDLAENYLERAKEIMTEYAARLQTEVSEHKLSLLTSVQSEMVDLDLQEYQSATRSTYVTTVRNLQALRTEFETLQSTPGGENVFVAVKNPVSSAMRFVVFGLVLGAFLSCFVLLLLYMLGGKLQDTEEFNEEFGMPLLGIVRISGQKRKIFGFIDSWVFQLRGGIYARISFDEQIKMVAANVETAISLNFPEGTFNKIMLSGTMPEKDATILCTRLASELQKVSMSPYKQIVFHVSDLKELKDYDGIVFLEKRGKSDSGFIVKEKKLALDRDVKVLGAIVTC